MSEGPPRDPAIGLLEFESIASGLVAADAMVKTSPIGSLYAGTVHPGRYLVLVSGDTASVEEALRAGREIAEDERLDSVFLPDVHPAVVDAMLAGRQMTWMGEDALGIVETATVATVIDAADAAAKAANVTVAAVQLADGLGGKGYMLLTGEVAEVEAAMEAALARIETSGRLLHHRLIPQLDHAVAENLRRDLRFLHRIEQRDAERSS